MREGNNATSTASSRL